MLTFIYSTVNAGKTATLLMRAHSCSERGVDYLILVPDLTKERDGEARVSSRVGFSQKATPLSPESCPYEVVTEGEAPQVVFVDEAQFLTPRQVMGLTRISDELNIPVFAFGLRSDFKGEPFQGSTYLFSWADQIEEISTHALGGGKAIFNMKVNEEGDRVSEGASVDIGFQYEPVTRGDFNLPYYWSPS
jgi:thymidine kinase